MSLEWLRCIPLQLVLAVMAVKMSMVQIMKLHLTFVSVAVVTGVDDHVLLPCF